MDDEGRAELQPEWINMKLKNIHIKLKEHNLKIQDLNVKLHGIDKNLQILTDLYGANDWKPGLFYNITTKFEWLRNNLSLHFVYQHLYIFLSKLLSKVLWPTICLAILINIFSYLVRINTYIIVLTLGDWLLSLLLSLSLLLLYNIYTKFLQAAVISFILIYGLALAISFFAITFIRGHAPIFGSAYDVINFQFNQISAVVLVASIILVVTVTISPSIAIIKRQMQTIDRKWIYYDPISTMLPNVIVCIYFIIAVDIWVNQYAVRQEHMTEIIKNATAVDIDNLKKFASAKLQLIMILPIFTAYVIYLLSHEYAIDKKCKQIYG